MALFFFGTLMDPAVMATVLDRPFDASDFETATLQGYARKRALNASYPVLIRDVDASTQGLLLRAYSDEDRARIDHFEDEEYELAPVAVRLSSGAVVEARAYMALDGVFEVADEAWSFEDWRAAHGATYLDRCREWMADYVSPYRDD